MPPTETFETIIRNVDQEIADSSQNEFVKLEYPRAMPKPGAHTAVGDKKSQAGSLGNVSALSTSKLANQVAPKVLNSSQANKPRPDPYPMDKLLAKLTEQQAVLNQQNEALKTSEDEPHLRRTLDNSSTTTSLPMTPATEAFQNTAPTTRPSSANFMNPQDDEDKVLRLKLQLAQAQTHISKLEEIAHNKVGQPENEPQRAYSARNLPTFGRGNSWNHGDDAQSDTSDPTPISGFGRARGIWGGFKNFSSVNLAAPSRGHLGADLSSIDWSTSRGHGSAYSDMGQGQPPVDAYRSSHFNPESDSLMRRPIPRGAYPYDNRFAGVPGISPAGYGGAFAGNNGQFDPMMGNLMPNGPLNPPQGSGGMAMSFYHHSSTLPSENSLSPHASEFTTSKEEWKSEGMPSDLPTYLPPTEPLNYRRLLDRNVNCNWKYIVDKIVCNNDQQASIFLQQKLKVGTPEQKYEIVEAIVAQAYPLMVNRFGNFLVQRCFEHGTPEQVIKIAEAIRGNTLNLSMDPFGCHVVQKAFDSVPENYKAIMVHELLRRIPETVIHRYACHVWQKLFELRWTESPPQIMEYVNEALQGMWHEVALGETGSLVVQNIFENCLEDDKRPCIEEVLANIDIVAHGQFGNWCIQHICEHGGPPDRSRAIDHVIRYAAEYSTDQFASKVVEMCLKIGGDDFLGRYLDRVCEGRRDRTRIPLIDIASDQYGNYLVQWVLNNASSQHRDLVAAHIRKHMVSLRGSKFGSRVGMLCTNHAVTTRPGPGVGPGVSGRIGPPGPRYGNAPYR